LSGIAVSDQSTRSKKNSEKDAANSELKQIAKNYGDLLEICDSVSDSNINCTGNSVLNNDASWAIQNVKSIELKRCELLRIGHVTKCPLVSDASGNNEIAQIRI
jgi:hypothetical protein